MSTEPRIALDCPYCHKAIYANINWFQKTYNTCPHCEQGLVASQFETAIADLVQAMEDRIEEMLNGQTGGGCGGKSTCGCSGHA